MVSATLPILLALAASGTALVCYETDNDGTTYERENPSWKYCSYFPPSSSTDVARSAGVGPTVENLDGYDVTFGQNSRLYKILTVCIYERYDFGAINPALGSEPEFMFRCVCNTDRCNVAATFSKYLDHVRVTSTGAIKG